MEILKWIPEFITHTYWDKKEHFLLEHDIYLTWVLFAIEEGKLEFQIEDEKGQAEFGDVVVCPPYVAFHRVTLSPLSFHAITFDFSERESHLIHKIFPHRKIHFPHKERLSENYQQLKLEDQYSFISHNSQKLKQHYFLDLWLLIINQYRQYPDIDTLKEKDYLMESIALYLKNHAHETIEIKHVASQFGLTPVQLIRRFKNVYQINPLQYLTTLRIKTACSLLLQTNWTLDMIAAKCGYENGYYLSRVFSKHMGIRPSSFRKQNQI